MATMNVSLPDEMKEWVEARSASGEYANSSDYVRDLIRHDQQRRKAVTELQMLIDEGIASGPVEPWNLEEFLAEMPARNGGE